MHSRTVLHDRLTGRIPKSYSIHSCPFRTIIRKTIIATDFAALLKPCQMHHCKWKSSLARGGTDPVGPLRASESEVE